jgi:hypothetical protein
MGGGSQAATVTQLTNNQGMSNLNSQAGANNLVSGSQSLQNLLQQAATGQITASQAMQSADALSGNNPLVEQAIQNNPQMQQAIASQQVMGSAPMQGLYGAGGLQSQAENNYSGASNNLASDRQALMGNDQSYGLTSQDLAAYGQASDQASRMFAGQGQQLSQQLANQGLGAANSGSAAQGFSNIYGNQMEQLQGLQNQISQNRINTAMNLAQARTSADLNEQNQSGALAGNLGAMGQSAINSQQNLNQQGINGANQQMDANAGQLQNQANSLQNQANTQFDQQQASGLNFNTLLGGGLGAATGSAGSAVGGAAAGAAGSAASGLGGLASSGMGSLMGGLVAI